MTYIQSFEKTQYFDGQSSVIMVIFKPVFL